MHVNSATQITITTPPGSGIVPVHVVGANGTSPLSDGSYFDYRAAGLVLRRSLSATATQGDDTSDAPSLSLTGRRSRSVSTRPTSLPGDTNGVRDIFVKNTLTGSIRRITPTEAGTPQFDASSWSPALSGDGTAVAFRTHAPI